MMRWLALAAYGATIPAANWMIGHVGLCAPPGPCVIPVGFGLTAPSGVLMVGAALVLRDGVQEAFGLRVTFAAVAAGAALSAFLAPPSLVIASAVAFAISETGDLAVYTPLRRRSLPLAVMASGAVGAVIDSAAFLWLAFGSLAFLEGQVVGKLMISAAAAFGLMLTRRGART